MDGNIHAEELTAGAAVTYLLDTLVAAQATDERVGRMLRRRTFYLVPRVNPDGAEHVLTTPYPWVGNGRLAPPLVPERGLYYEDVDGDGFEKGNFLSLMAQMAKEAQRGALSLAEVGLAACQGMDLILAGIGGLFTGVALAEKLGLPLLQAYYAPFTPTQAYPSFLLPRLPAWLGSVLNRPSYLLARQVIWQGFRSADNMARKETLGLPPAPFSGPYLSDCIRGLSTLYGYSPTVIPPPPDWGDDIHVTGYWFLDAAESWSPPPDLMDFLEAGPPPGYHRVWEHEQPKT